MKKLLSVFALAFFCLMSGQSFSQNVINDFNASSSLSNHKASRIHFIGTSSFICALIGDNISVTITPPNPEVCLGSAITLTANVTDNTSSTFSYTWSTNGSNDTINPIPTTSGSFSVTVIDGLGCSSSATSFVVVNSNPAVTVASQSMCMGNMDTLTAVVTDASSSAYTYTWNTGGTHDTIDVSPSTNSTYTVNVVDGNGCVGSATGNVKVNSLPVVSVSNDSTCAGSAVVLTASVTDLSSSKFTYLWNTTGTNDTINTAPLSTADYSVTVTDSNGCMGTGKDTVNILALPNVTFDSSGFGNPVCQGGGPLMLMGGSPAGGTYSGTNVASGQFTPSSTGNFSILYTYTNGSGCTDTASYVVSVQVCTGINTIQTSTGIDVYPNPAINSLFIKFNGDIGTTATIVINDVAGRILAEALYSVSSNLILPVDISVLPEGMYFIKITTDKTSLESKFIKQD